MKCAECGFSISYEGGKGFLILSEFEMIYGEHCVYPMEIKKTILCSEECLRFQQMEKDKK